MKGAAWSPLVAAAILACTDAHTVLLPELPDHLDYAGVVYRGPRGAWSGSGLYSTRLAPLRVEVWLDERDYDELSFVGFREADLRSFTQSNDDELQRQPLEAPGPRRAPVRSSFSASGNAGDDPASLEVDAQPLYVGGYWAGSCPEYAVSMERRLEHYCLETPCPVSLRQAGCTLETQFSPGRRSSCQSALSSVLPGVGPFAARSLGGTTSCSGQTSLDRELTLTCTEVAGGRSESCQLELPRRPDDVPSFEVESRALVDLPEPGTTFARALSGLVVLSDRVLTVRSRRGFDTSAGCEPHEVELVHLSRAALEVTFTATSPPSVLGLLAGGPDELFAVLGGAEPEVASLSLSGEVRRRRRIDPELSWTLLSGSGVELCPELEAIAAAPRGDAAAFILSTDPSSANAESRLVVVDLETLELRFPPVSFGRGVRLTTLWFPSADQVEVLAEGRDRHPVSLLTGALGASSSFYSELGRPAFTGRAILPWPEKGVAVLAALEDSLTRALVVGSLSGEPPQYRAFWEDDRAPFELARWPGPRPLALVSLGYFERGERPATDATLAFFDVEAQRFLSPSHELGGAPLTHLQSTDDGEFFGLSPADGRIHRIRPVP